LIFVDTPHRWKKYKKSLIIGVTVLGVVLVGLIITAAVVSTRHTTEPKIRAPKNVVQSYHLTSQYVRVTRAKRLS
jgi:flagellar basal body-associated protein FliL